jgi:HSP20 family protein
MLYGDPFRDMRRLQSEVNRLFQSAAGASGAESFPAMNIYASQEGVALTAELPGVAREDLEISVHRDTVTLKGERKEPEGEEIRGFHRRERGRGRFVRTISLPFQIDPERVGANLENGVLRLSLQRPESDKPKTITVNAS